MKDVSILLVNYKTPLMTINCVQSIINHTYSIKYEIIIIDNGSNDNSIELFQENYCENNDVIIVDAKSNLGFGKAKNLGATFASGKYLFLLNNDTVLLDNAVKSFYNFMEDKKNSNIAVCGGNLLDSEKKPTHSYNELPNIRFERQSAYKFIARRLKRNRARNDFNFTDKIIEVGYITGADLFIRTTIFQEINGFDQDFFMYSEESEMCYRIKKCGYKIVNIPYINIIHLEGQSVKSSLDYNPKRFEMFCEGRYLYYYKVYGIKTMKKLNKILKNSFILKYILSFFNKKYLNMLKIVKITYKNTINKIGGSK